MSLLSLLIALAAERSLSSSWWRFQHYYNAYLKFFNDNDSLTKFKQSNLGCATFVLLPVVITSAVLNSIDNGLLNLLLSTVILIICFGCVGTRASYKNYLQSAFRDEETTTELHHQQLLQDKNLPQMGFGQALVWLNYRYYIAIMLYFTLFGAAGVVFYRLLTTVIEQESLCANKGDSEPVDEEANQQEEAASIAQVDNNAELETINPANIESGSSYHHDVLFWLDWLPVRITSFGYMFVGHFSKAIPVWLENLFDFHKPTYKVLIDVAETSEDLMVGKEDCTAEPCLLVRLAKRSVLLFLAVISILTLAGLIN